MYNAGIQEIAQAGTVVPTWEQVNVNGFGDPQTGEVSALAAFNNYLYAGTTNAIAGARIFRSQNGTAWTPVTQAGFGISHDIAPPSILDMEVFNGRLYASTGRGDGPAQIWRSLDGLNWAPMVISGFNNPDTVDITALAVYNNMIYAGAINQVSGAQIWRSYSGDSNTWTQVAPTVPGGAANNITGFAVFNGALYAAVESNAPAQLWRSTGGAWTTVMNNGFGHSLTTSTGGMAVFGGYLYVGAGNSSLGAQLWRSNNGSTWEQAIGPGFGDPNNQKVETVFVFQNQLYASVRNTGTGIEVWRSADGALWEQVNLDGFGDSNNSGTNWSNATTEFQSQFYVGTLNQATGGELWRMVGPLPDTPTATPTFTSTATATDTPTSTPTDVFTFTPTDTATSTATSTPTFTPTGTPTSTFTGIPSDTPTYTPTNTPTSTSTGPVVETATDTPTASLTPTPTSMLNFTPTFTPTDAATDTPTYTPTPTPVFSTPGKVTGGGNIDLSSGGKATFGFIVRYKPGDEKPSGNLTFMDHSAKLGLKATSFDLLVIEGKQVLVTGEGVLNNGQVTEFEITMDVLDQPDRPDSFHIYIPATNAYRSGGTLKGGNITIHK